MQKISIIIPTLNEEKYLTHLLESIKKQSIAPKEIIVVDALSQDKTKEIALAYGCKVLDDIKKKGPGAGRNKGARIAILGKNGCGKCYG